MHSAGVHSGFCHEIHTSFTAKMTPTAVLPASPCVALLIDLALGKGLAHCWDPLQLLIPSPSRCCE